MGCSWGISGVGKGTKAGRRHLRKRVSGVDKRRDRWVSPPAFHAPIFLAHMGQKEGVGSWEGILIERTSHTFDLLTYGLWVPDALSW